MTQTTTSLQGNCLNRQKGAFDKASTYSFLLSSLCKLLDEKNKDFGEYVFTKVESLFRDKAKRSTISPFTGNLYLVGMVKDSKMIKFLQQCEIEEQVKLVTIVGRSFGEKKRALPDIFDGGIG